MPDSTNDELAPFDHLFQNTAVARDYVRCDMTEEDINDLATRLFFVDAGYKYDLTKTPIDNVFSAYRLAVSKLIRQHTEQAVEAEKSAIYKEFGVERHTVHRRSSSKSTILHQRRKINES